MKEEPFAKNDQLQDRGANPNGSYDFQVTLWDAVSADESLGHDGPVRVGDLLTTSSTPGYAMRCANLAKCVGAVVGKALEPLTGGKALIKVLVMDGKTIDLSQWLQRSKRQILAFTCSLTCYAELMGSNLRRSTNPG